MSQIQREQELINQIIYNLTRVTDIMEQVKKDHAKAVEEVQESIERIRQEGKGIPDLKTILKAIEAAPSMNSKKLLTNSKKLNWLAFIRKSSIVVPDMEDKLVKDWVDSFIETYYNFNVEYYQNLMDLMNKIMFIIGKLQSVRIPDLREIKKKLEETEEMDQEGFIIEGRSKRKKKILM